MVVWASDPSAIEAAVLIAAGANAYTPIWTTCSRRRSRELGRSMARPSGGRSRLPIGTGNPRPRPV